MSIFPAFILHSTYKITNILLALLKTCSACILIISETADGVFQPACKVQFLVEVHTESNCLTYIYSLITFAVKVVWKMIDKFLELFQYAFQIF